MLGTVDTVELQAVAVDIHHLVAVVMPIDTTHQTWEEVEVTSEGLAHVIIKLVAVGALGFFRGRPTQSLTFIDIKENFLEKCYSMTKVACPRF